MSARIGALYDKYVWAEEIAERAGWTVVQEPDAGANDWVALIEAAESLAAAERRAEELGRRLEAIARLAACEGHTPLYSEACDRLLEIGALALPPEESRR